MLRKLLYTGIAAVSLFVGANLSTPITNMNLESRLMEIRRSDDKLLFGKDNLNEYIADGGTFEFAQFCAKLVNQDNKPALNDEHVKYLHNRASTENIRKLLDIKDNRGRNMMDGYHIQRLTYYRHQRRASEDSVVDFASRLASIQYPDGRQFLLGEDIVNLYYNQKMNDDRINPEAIEMYVSWARQFNRPLKGYELLRYLHLGKEKHEIYEHLQTGKDMFYTDTEKPDYRLFFSASDHNGAYHGQAIRDLFRRLSKKKVIVRICENDNELAEELRKNTTPEVHIFAGHGTQISLDLGNKEPLMWRRVSDYRTLDISDRHVAIEMRKQTKNQFTYLIACKAGEGGYDAVNLANWVSRNLRGQLSAPTHDQDINAIVIQKENPFILFFAKSHFEPTISTTYITNLYQDN
jgi:hypothetical protein